MAKKINITAQLNAATTDGILADAGQIFDTKKGKFQEQVNQEFEDALEEAITSEETDMVVESIEEGIVHNALRKTEQILTEAEKGQARENIGAVSEQTFENEAVRVKKQVFTSEQKYQARHNISAITAEEAEKIAQDKINETSVSSPDKLQAVKELSSWLESNPDSAATMNADIQENAADIQRLYRGTGIDEYSQFSALKDYAAGDVVLYDGVLFRFKADHAKGEWDYNEVEEWSEKKEREERVEELGSKVREIVYDSMFDGEGTEYKSSNGWQNKPCYIDTEGNYRYWEGVGGWYYTTPYIPVHEISEVSMKGRFVKDTSAITQYDKDYNVISVRVEEEMFELSEVILENTKFIRCCGDVRYPFELRMKNSSYKEYVRKVQENQIKSFSDLESALLAESERAKGAENINSKSIKNIDLLICDTMLNVDGVEFKDAIEWDYMKSVFLAANTGVETHYSNIGGPFYVSPYIAVNGLKNIHVYLRTSTNTAYCVFYDEDKHIVNIINAEGSIDIDVDIDIPNDASYVRMCGNIEYNPLRVSIKNSSYKEYVRKVQEERKGFIEDAIKEIKVLTERNADRTKKENNTASNPLYTIKETAGLTSIFHEIGFIGDSLSSGLNYDPYGFEGSNIFTAYPFSWCQRLVALIGNANGANYSVGGWTTRSWISNVWVNEQPSRYTTNGNEEYFKTDKKQCYFICLGTNDNNQNIPIGSVDTDIDMSDFSNNADTFAGNYGGIIQRIKSVQPSAKIFVITIPKYFSATAEDNGYNTVIRDISKKFGNVFLLDVQKYSPDVTSLYRYGGHLDTPGYQWFAYLIATYVDYIIRANELKFRYVSIIGTEHDHGDL